MSAQDETRDRGVTRAWGHFFISPAFLWSVILFGVFVRLSQYLHNRSLWVDEAMLAREIIQRSFRELFAPLSYDMVGPVGYLVSTKLAVVLFGPSEYALRVVALVAGIASVLLFWRVARLSVTRGAVPLAVCLFAVCDPAIYYASEAKQYSSDVAIAAGLLWLAFAFREKPLDARRTVLLALAGAAAVWFSYPAVFVLAGAGLPLGIGALIRREWRRAGLLAVAGAAWIASFAAFYFLTLEAPVHNEYQISSWRANFMPFPPTSLSDAKWFINSFLGVLKYPVGFGLAGLAAFAFVVGAIRMLRRDGGSVLMLVLPILLALAASGLGKYPFIGRLMLFSIPSFLLVISAGVEEVRSGMGKYGGVAGVALTAMLLFHPVLEAIYHLASPRPKEEIREVLEEVAEKRQEGDIVYVYLGARAPFEYYRGRYGFQDAHVIHGVKARTEWKRYREDLSRLVGNKRVWIIFSHVCTWHGVNEELLFLHYLDDLGRQISSFRSVAASAYLYDLSGRAPTSLSPRKTSSALPDKVLRGP